MELTLIFLGQIPSHGIYFWVSGAFHHARWMSKLLHVKDHMLLSHWCSYEWSHTHSEYNKLQECFWTYLQDRTAIGLHLWYLDQKIVPLAFFSDNVPDDAKRLMAIEERVNSDVRSIRYSGQNIKLTMREIESLTTKPLHYFIAPASYLFSEHWT